MSLKNAISDIQDYYLARYPKYANYAVLAGSLL